MLKTESLLEISKKYAVELIEGLNRSVTPFHAVDYCRTTLLGSGFNEISESDTWSLNKGGKYFYTRNNSTLIAFTVGKLVNLNKTCFKIVGAHTDSPNLRLAPNSITENGNFEKYNLQTYGGGIWQTWFDRDLSIAGKMIVREPETKMLGTRLFRCDEPLFRIPHLAIHLSTDRNKFEWNNENHLKAILSTTVFDEKVEKNNLTTIDKKIGTKLSNLISNQIHIPKEDIVDFDLCLYDSQPASLTGIGKEFISSGRLDNLCTSLTSLRSLITSAGQVDNQNSINILALFDNEEVGSLSFQGADANFFAENLKRIFTRITHSDQVQSDSFDSCVARSFCISADMAHAYNPNYGEKYQPQHKPEIHRGVTIKINPQSRYATDSEGSAIIKDLCTKKNLLYQEFIVKQDSPCGTTIGPIISGKLGIKTVDIGMPQWAMHSIREMCGTVDLYYYRTLFEEFYLNYENVVGNLIKK